MSGSRRLPTLAVTTGEPAGIGPDLCAAVAAGRWDCRIVLLGDRSLLGRVRGTRRRMSSLPDYDPASPARRRVEILHVPLAAPCTPGRLDPANAGYVLRLLDRACDGCRSGEFSAMVTAPVHKGAINDAGEAFTGHTEYLAERCGADRPVMLLAGGGLRVALATTHLPLAHVPAAMTGELLDSVLRVLDADLRRLYAIRRPRILVCGLNPHAGEGGHLGREEIDVIAPALERLRRAGLSITGPVPADTAFLPARLAECDAVLAMYHDQGLPVLKREAFADAVNVTLGLPIVRTSVDHGTALELAGTGRADPGSLLAAVRLAARFSGRRRR
ncbi:MAG TPA: 4-hydroxythreonine-4-phosphate dehydrogenase PdxA [Steroidobacteraceae bacterium]|nr:4-hydroxythreonine-4-phosphate dehydrogenase PdxA [Steroidobacteraceae bacterium]